MSIELNSGYLKTNRGVIKILQIIIGIIICSFLCSHWYGGSSCFGEGKLGYCSALNFLCLLINVIFFILNLINIRPHGLERIYSFIGTVLFFIAVVLVAWYIFEYNINVGWLIVTAALLVVQFILFLYDIKILGGESSNY